MTTKRLLLWAMLPMAIGCGSSDKHLIEEAAYQYAYFTSNYQIDSAAHYATSETQRTTLVMAERIMQAVGDDYIQSDTPATVEIPRVEQTADTEAYALYHKTTPIKDFTDTLYLRKREGKWLVHCPLPVMKRPEKPSTDNSQQPNDAMRIRLDEKAIPATSNLK